MRIMKSAGILLKVLHDDIRTSFNKALVQFDLTISQTEVLGYIYLCTNIGKKINQIDIQNEFSLSNPTVTGILKRLEKKDYIRRIRCEDDARYKIVELTDLGMEICNTMKERAFQMDHRLVENFTDEEKEMLFYLLRKMRDNINSYDSK